MSEVVVVALAVDVDVASVAVAFGLWQSSWTWRMMYSWRPGGMAEAVDVELDTEATTT